VVLSTLGESKSIREIMIEDFVPTSRSLFKSVQRLSKSTDQIFFSRFNAAFGLFHINRFLQLPVQERSFHIHLMDVHPALVGDGQENAKGLQAHHRGESLLEVNSRDL
jgi:hypothetical protein